MTLLGFDPEKSTQFELGIKGEFMGGRGNFTIAGFHTSYKDRQFEFIVPNPSGEGLIDGVSNIGDSNQWGIELSALVRASDFLTLSGSFGYIDAEWDEGTVLVDGTDVSGETPPNVIGTSASFNADLDVPLSDSIDLFGGLQVSHNGSMLGGKPSDNVRNPSFTVADLQMGLVAGSWELAVNVQNLFDEDYYTDLEPFPNFGFDGLTGTGPETFIIGTFGQPRLVTASATFRF